MGAAGEGGRWWELWGMGKGGWGCGGVGKGVGAGGEGESDVGAVGEGGGSCGGKVGRGLFVMPTLTVTLPFCCLD